MFGIMIAAATAVAPVVLPPRVETAITAAVDEATAAQPSVSCTRQASPPGYSCLQPGRDNRDHFAALSVTARPAARRIANTAVDSTLFGPGGGSSRYVGQTPDHRFDIVVTEASSLGREDVKLLPSAPAMIERIVTLYRSSRR